MVEISGAQIQYEQFPAHFSYQAVFLCFSRFIIDPVIVLLADNCILA